MIKERIRMMNQAINNTIASYSVLARKQGLSYNALMVLYFLEDNEKSTQQNICDTLQLPKSTVHSILLDFVKKGYMTLQTTVENRKEKIIFITDRGKEYLQTILEPVHNAESRTMERLGNELCSQLIVSNKAFCEIFSQEVENEA